MVEGKSTNIFHQKARISREEHEQLKGHRGLTLWFTGLSAAGKSTVAAAVEEALFKRGCHTYVLDGDNIRAGLNSNLGFSPEDRGENIRRIGEVAKLFRSAGIINLVAFISPYRADRRMVREMGEGWDFIEIFIDCPVQICEDRDPKGLYAKAREGEIQGFTGIDAPYERPENPELHLHTDRMSIPECVEAVVDYLVEKRYISELR